MSLYMSVTCLHLPGPQIIAEHTTEERMKRKVTKGWIPQTCSLTPTVCQALF